MEHKEQQLHDPEHLANEWLNSVSTLIKKCLEYNKKTEASPLLPLHNDLAKGFNHALGLLKSNRDELEGLISDKSKENWASDTKKQLAEAKKSSSDLAKQITGFDALYRIHYNVKKVKVEPKR